MDNIDVLFLKRHRKINKEMIRDNINAGSWENNCKLKKNTIGGNTKSNNLYFPKKTLFNSPNISSILLFITVELLI
jgi:hypothetical protein